MLIWFIIRREVNEIEGFWGQCTIQENKEIYSSILDFDEWNMYVIISWEITKRI